MRYEGRHLIFRYNCILILMYADANSHSKWTEYWGADQEPPDLSSILVSPAEALLSFTNHNASKVRCLYQPSTDGYTTSRGGPTLLKPHSVSRAMGLVN